MAGLPDFSDTVHVAHNAYEAEASAACSLPRTPIIVDSSKRHRHSILEKSNATSGHRTDNLSELKFSFIIGSADFDNSVHADSVNRIGVSELSIIIILFSSKMKTRDWNFRYYRVPIREK